VTGEDLLVAGLVGLARMDPVDREVFVDWHLLEHDYTTIGLRLGVSRTRAQQRGIRAAKVMAAHLFPPVKKPARRRCYSSDTQRSARGLRNLGFSYREIARRLGVQSETTVARWCDRGYHARELHRMRMRKLGDREAA